MCHSVLVVCVCGFGGLCLEVCVGWSCIWVGVLMLRVVSASAGSDVSKKRDCYEILV